MNKITFGNKVDTKVTSVAEINKVTGANLNEIKSVTNSAVNQLELNTPQIASNKEDITSLINGNGKTYISVSNAMLASPLPSDNTPFTIRDSVSNLEDGYYIYLSTEAGGYKFLEALEAMANGYYVVNSLLDFNSLISNASTGVWMIISDITLGANKTIPAGVTLQFRNAKINLGGFTLTGAETKIDAGISQIFDINGIVTGFKSVEVYPQWFGATGNGATNDSPAVQKTIDFAEDFSTIVFPYGVYRLESTITIDKGITLNGLNSTITTIHTNNIGIDVVSNKVKIKNFSFNKSGQTLRFNKVVLFRGNDSSIENCNFIGNGKTVGEYGRGVGIQMGIGTVPCVNLSIIKCKFKNYESCIRTATAKNLTVTSCFFTGGIDPTYASANYGTAYLGDGLKLSLDNDDDDTSTGVDYTSIDGVIVTNCIFNSMERDGIDLYLKGSNCTFSNNVFIGSFNKCFDVKVIYLANDATSIPLIRQTKCVTITGNQFYELNIINSVIDVITTTDGSTVLDNQNTSQAVIVSDNLFEDSNSVILNIYNSSLVSFTNNIVRNLQSTSNSDYVIKFSGTSNKKQFNFSSNQVRVLDELSDLGFIYIDSACGEIECLSISNNTYYGGEDDIFLYGLNESVKDLIVTGNIINGNLSSSGLFGASHIKLNNLNGAIISNNVMRYSNVEAVRIDGAFNCRIENNIIGFSGFETSRKEIRIEDGTSITASDHVYIKNNTLHDNYNTTSGVNIGSAGVDIIVIDNNTF
mgnify:FL=1|tara:strand:- start:351 stop:2606 length:2256 start_codon:yes stop_codon:yes gene_type:complete